MVLEMHPGIMSNKNAIQEYTVKSGETVTAGDIVQFVDGKIQKGVGGQSGETSFGNEIVYNEGSTNYISVSSLRNARKISSPFKFQVMSPNLK